jgi:phosphoglycolate phosphatase-like HAD superfamily hydrolase
MVNFSGIKMIIWDMDQTLYPYWEDFADYCHEATAHCALEEGVPLTKDDAITLSKISYKERGVTTRLFNEQYGLDEVELFRAHHRRMIDRLIDPNWCDKIKPNPELKELMAQAQAQGVRQVILTNGAQCWAQHIAELLEIDEYMDVIMGADDFALRQKGREGILPFMAVLGAANFKGFYDEVLVVEDSLKNMMAPKEYEMKTAWVQWSHPEYHKWPQPHYVDMIFEKPNDVLKKLHQDFQAAAAASIQPKQPTRRKGGPKP